MSLRVALHLGRVSNLPTVWTNVVAGAVLAGAGLHPGAILALLVSFSLLYVAGMYLNDAFDRHLDARERPGRPIPSGAVRASTVFTAGFGMLAAGEVGVGAVAWTLQGSGAWAAVVAGLALAGVILFYNVWHKTNPLSPLVMGVTRVLVYLTAGFALAPGGSTPLALGAGAMLCHLIGLTYAAKQENLTELAGVWPLAFLAVPLGYGTWLSTHHPATFVFVILLASWILYALRFLLVPERRSIPDAVLRLIAGISLLDGLLIAGTGHAALGLVLLFGCPLARLFQRYVPGT